MTNQWSSQTHLKIHEGCGGLIRWVEAIEDPRVGYHGECECGETDIVVEDMIPIEVPDQYPLEVYNEIPPDTLAALRWDDEADFEANQERLRDELPVEIGGGLRA